MVDTDKDPFLLISEALTGIDPQHLAAKVDPIMVAEEYRRTLDEELKGAEADAYQQMLKAFADKSLTVEQILADADLGPIARSIIKLWLLGAWYPPATPANASKVVSSQAYKESLVWKAMQSHPMGYSMFTFGYWNEQPPALEEFLKFVP